MTPAINQAHPASSGASAPERASRVLANVNAQTNSADSSGSIAANDFLTLLVTEMKNQDPTANTDPNEYVNQLVQVNSLQQLISINQTLQSAVSTAPKTETAGSSRTRVDVPGIQTQPPRHNDGGLKSATPGNISTPAQQPAGLRLSAALAGK